MTRGLRVSDWMKLQTGDKVTEIDGRHVGRVEAIKHGAFVVVRWDDTGWISELALGDLILFSRTVHNSRFGGPIRIENRRHPHA